LLAIDGVAYLVYSFADLLAPGFATHLVPWIQLPAPIAEGAFSLWLLVFGVNTKWWTTRAGRQPTRRRAASRAFAGADNVLLTESPGDLVLEVLHGGPTGFDAGFALPGQDIELGASVTRVGSSYHIAQGLELVDKLAHGLRAHVRAAGELGEPRAGLICAKTAECEGFWGNPAPTTPSTMRKPSRLKA
jgi:hypothetical protein